MEWILRLNGLYLDLNRNDPESHGPPKEKINLNGLSVVLFGTVKKRYPENPKRRVDMLLICNKFYVFKYILNSNMLL